MLRLDRDSETYAVRDAIGRIIGAARGVVGAAERRILLDVRVR